MKESIEKKNQPQGIIKKTLTSGYFYGILFLVVLSRLLTRLFYRQSIRYNGEYKSDVPYYVGKAAEKYDSGRAISFFFSKLYWINENTLGIALFLVVLTIGSIIVTFVMIRWLVNSYDCQVPFAVLFFATVVCTFEGSIYLPKVYSFFYTGTWHGVTWHSPSQRMMLIFGLLSIILFIKLYSSYLVKIRVLYWIAFALAILIATWAKPNFIMIFYPAVGILFLIDLIKKDKKYSRGYKLKKMFFLAGATIPTFLFFFWLTFRMHSTGAENYVVIDFAYGFMKKGIPALKPLLGMGFPLLVLAFNFPRLREKLDFKLAWGVFMFGLLEYLLFIEEGPRKDSGNFSWGLTFSIALLFVICISVFIENFYKKDFLSNKKAVRTGYLCTGIGLLLLHTISGIIYFILLLKGYPPFLI